MTKFNIEGCVLMINRPYKILIVEDNTSQAEALKTCINKDDKFNIIGVTNSAPKAIEIIKNALPDAIVVDILLREGTGLQILEWLNHPETKLDIYPFKLVVTNLTSEKTHSILATKLADFPMRKDMINYSPEQVLNHLRIFSSEFDCNKMPKAAAVESNLEKELQLREAVKTELDNYYLGPHKHVKEYLIDAICMVIELPRGKKALLSKEIFPAVARKHNISTWRSVDQSITRMVNTAFEKTSLEDLRRLYKPGVDVYRGAPTNKEFILYTADKLINQYNIS